MSTAELDNATAEDDFADDGGAPPEVEQQIENTEPAPELAEGGETSDYDIDLGDETPETTPETPGESDPPAEVAETTPEPAVPGPDDGESFPPELLSRTNLDAERAKAVYGTPENLENAWLVAMMQRGRELDNAASSQSLQAPAATPSSPPPETAPTPKEVEEFLKLTLPEGIENLVDTEAAEVIFNSIGEQVGGFLTPQFKKFQETLQQQQQVIQSFMQRDAEEARRRHDEEFESFIEELPEEWHELFGKGKGNDAPKPGTPQFNARAQLFHQKRILESGAQDFGQSLPMREALQLGLRTAFPQKYDTVIKKSVTDQRRNGTTRLARPNARKAAPPSSDQAAIANLAKRLKEGGHNSESSGLSEEDFI